MIVSPSECCSASDAGASPSAAERRPCEIGPFWMDSAGRSLAPAWSHSLALYEIEKKGGRETQWAIQKGGFEYYLVTAHFPARCPFQRLSESRADGRPEGEATWDRRSLWHLHTAAVWPFHLTLYSPQRPVLSFFFILNSSAEPVLKLLICVSRKQGVSARYSCYSCSATGSCADKTHPPSVQIGESFLRLVCV